MHSCITFLVVRIYPHSTLNKKQKGKIIDAIISVTREQNDLRKESVFFSCIFPFMPKLSFPPGLYDMKFRKGEYIFLNSH